MGGQCPLGSKQRADKAVGSDSGRQKMIRRCAIMEMDLFERLEEATITVTIALRCMAVGRAMVLALKGSLHSEWLQRNEDTLSAADHPTPSARSTPVSMPTGFPMGQATIKMRSWTADRARKRSTLPPGRIVRAVVQEGGRVAGGRLIGPGQAVRRPVDFLVGLLLLLLCRPDVGRIGR